MSDITISVSAKALGKLLIAVTGLPFEIKQLKATRGYSGNCIDQLQREYKTEVERLSGVKP